MSDDPRLVIEQTLLEQVGGEFRNLASSRGLRVSESLPDGLREVWPVGPTGASADVPTEDALFAFPLRPAGACIVRVRFDPAAVRYRLLFVSGDLYGAISDPFLLDSQYPPRWEARGELPPIVWPSEPVPPRRVEDLQRILKDGDAPLLLGSVQALIDGGKIALVRDEPATAFMAGLWQLLPAASRAELWPATFAFANRNRFDIVALPPAAVRPGEVEGYLTEEQALDYPKGRYELNLQIAVEAGDQAELDRLLARRTSGQMVRLALFVLAACFILGAVLQALTNGPGR